MISTDFACGFIAGEGSFTLTTRSRRNSHTITPQLSVIVHKKDEDTLKSLKEYFDCGKIYDSGRKNEETKMWRVSNKDGLQNVLEILNGCNSWKVTEKYEQYKVWRESVNLYLVDYHTSVENRIRMAEIDRDELNVGLGKSEESWNEFISQLRH